MESNYTFIDDTLAATAARYVLIAISQPICVDPTPQRDTSIVIYGTIELILYDIFVVLLRLELCRPFLFVSWRDMKSPVQVL